MQKISSSQLRAARALLNWSRADLSKLCGISELTIHRFENGINEPKERTTNKLINIFEHHGVEFSDHNGVRSKPDDIDVYDGVERFDDFYDFLYDHLNRFGGHVSASCYDETLFVRYRKDPSLHFRRMKKLVNQKKILSFRVLTTISDFDPLGYSTFRWYPDQSPSKIGFYLFGDCLALLSFVNKKSPHVIVVRSAPLAEGYRQYFNLAWKAAQKPPPLPVILKTWPKDLPLPPGLQERAKTLR